MSRRPPDRRWKFPAANSDTVHASSIHPGQPDFNLRGKLHTDEHGRFELTTIRPAPYHIPDQGPTGRLLNGLGRHPWRPAHIHVKISADGYQPLTTQLYFQGDELLDSDVASAVKDDLIVPPQPAGSDEGSRLTLRYDFQLAPIGP